MKMTRLRWALRGLALLLGAGQATVAMLVQSMNEDGINYLDMGDAYLSGDWAVAVNGIWSPLYSWILGALLRVLQPPLRWEFPTVHLANFIIYAITLVCFEFFWRELTARYERGSDDAEGTGFGSAVWMALGYSLFIWTALDMIEIWSVTPDMCVAASVYVAAGLMLRLGGPRATTTQAAMLGAVLGIGYLAKAVMMPLGIACLLLVLLFPAGSVGRVRRFAWSVATFLVVAGPFLVVLSIDYGKPTFADVGRFTYLKHVDEMPYPDFLPAVGRLAGAPEHPPRRIFADPPVYEFAEPVGGTYPMGYDPSYWTDGLQPTVTVAGQLRAVATNMMAYFDLLVRMQGGFLAVASLLVLASVRLTRGDGPRAPEVALLVWGLGAFGLYSLVATTPRYLAPFMLLCWAGLLAHVRLPDTPQSRGLLGVGGWVMVSFVWINIGATNLGNVAGLLGFSPLAEAESAVQPQSGGGRPNYPAIAEGLLEEGIARGDEVGFIGHSFSAFWARLARLRIVAEIQPHHVADFWQSDAARQAEILRAFADAGVVAVVAEGTASAPPPGWTRIGQTSYIVHTFR